MGLPEIVDLARNFAVMVRVQGPDPKGLKMRKHAFHHYHSGKTTLSASGMLLPDSLRNYSIANNHIGGGDNVTLVVTVASVLEPFLSKQSRENVSQVLPELIPGVQIDIMVEGKMSLENDLEESNKQAPSWLPAKLLTLVDIPVSSLALQTLIDASMGSPEHGWEVGWSLASYNAPQTLVEIIQTQVQHDANFSMESQKGLAARESNNPSLMGKSTTRIALLEVSSVTLKDLPDINISTSDKRGDLLLAMGSPFGVLSPMHFFNSISVGSIANFYQPTSSIKRSLLMADIRCLPGMEGGPVFGEQVCLIGILTRPLRQKTSGAEIQLVIPWEAIATACSDLLQKEPPNARNGVHYSKGNLYAAGKTSLSNKHNSDGHAIYIHGHSNFGIPPPSPVEKAMLSICLVTIDDGAWASGVLLNKQGLILTNAHLLEPWRFAKTTVNGEIKDTISEALFIPSERPASSAHEGTGGLQKSQGFMSETLNVADSSLKDDNGGYRFSSNYKGHSIRVRLDHRNPWIWCDARVVYVSRGPLDIALLQLKFVPDQLCPITMDFTCPLPGSKAYVIGHGLFGPRCDFFPSVCFGMVAKVVKAKMHLSSANSLQEDALRDFPAMLETTASVHPGGSGGAVFNSDGHMIGLVTSNARHGGGTIIPHLNFSIPCAALEPIFKFSKDMEDLSLLRGLDEPNKHLSSVWELVPSLSPKPDPFFPNLEDKNKAGKGSRFAKFIADRHEVFKRPTQLSKVESQMILSKL